MAIEHMHQEETGSSTDNDGRFGFDDLFNILEADKFYFAELDSLNNSGAEGAAFLALNGDKLTVVMGVTGVEANQQHIQHIHGMLDGTEGNVPTNRFDTNLDGIVDLAEGVPSYGPVLLNFDPFPTPSGTSFLFANTYDLSDPESNPMGDLVLRTEATDTMASQDVPLTNRVIVVHGASLLPGQGRGEGTEFGAGGFIETLPVAAGEIEELNREDGFAALLSSFAFGEGEFMIG